jgi:hypothetical protein
MDPNNFPESEVYLSPLDICPRCGLAEPDFSFAAADSAFDTGECPRDQGGKAARRRWNLDGREYWRP